MSPLASFIDSATNPLALAFLATGLLASVAIAGYPFARDLWRSTSKEPVRPPPAPRR
jgi:hypothetical protein